MVKLHYDNRYFDWQKDIGKLSGILELFKFKDHITHSDVICDIGCGGGYILSNLNAKRKFGIEINPVAIQEAKSFGLEIYHDVNLLEDNSIDVAISNHALEHIENPYELLKNLKSKIKQSGKVIFVVPHEDYQQKWDKNDINKHLYTWNRLTLGNLFEQAGYEVISVENIRHMWPKNFLKVYNIFGENLFHKICNINALIKNNYQVKIVAQVVKE